MARRFLNGIDGVGIPFLGFRLENLSAAPGSPSGAGHAYWDTALGAPRFYSGTVWRNPLARGDHTGTQQANTISDLATVVQGYRLDQFAAPTANIAMGGFTHTGIPAPTAAGQPAEYAWVIGLIQSAAAGIASKPPVRAVATSNQALSGLPTVDGVTLATGDRLLLTAQTTASQNGTWVVAAGAWSRGLDADQANELQAGATWLVTEGTTGAGTQWRQATTGAVVVGTTPISIVQFATGGGYSAANGVQLLSGTFSLKPLAGGGVLADATGVYVDTSVVTRKFNATVGDGAATTITVTHNLGTRDVMVQVYQAGSPYQTVEVDVNRTTVNSVDVVFGAPPAANAYRVVVQG